MKVYVITKGDYSDYHIVGVTTDKDKAETVAKEVSGEWQFNTASVETYDTDQFLTRLRYRVEFDGLRWSAHFDDYNYYDKYAENHAFSNVCFIIYADTKEEAIKVAQDMRAKMLAEKEGIC